MSVLHIPDICAPIRAKDAPNDIGDNLRVLYCASLLAVDQDLKSAQRTAAYLGLELPFWSWDEAVSKFQEKGRSIRGYNDSVTLRIANPFPHGGYSGSRPAHRIGVK